MIEALSGYNLRAMAQLSESAIKGKKTLREFQTIFEPVIETYFQEQIQKVKIKYDNKYSTHAAEVIQDICTRDAKRVRASFIYYVYQMFGGTNLDLALQMGVVIELIHAYLLIIDDFMDNSDKRRGGPTVHKVYEVYHKENKLKGEDSRYFGNAISADLGIMTAHMAFELLSKLNVDAKTLQKLNENLNEKLVITTHGQLIDTINAAETTVTEENIMKTFEWKTGVYTFENPIHVGAILAGVKDETLKKLSEFAIPGGISFQVQDDILGMFGDANVMGKSAMDDLQEGKYTLLIHKALENGDEKQKEIINKYLGKEDLTIEEHEKVKKVIIETGSLDYSKNLAQNLVKQAKDSLAKNREPNWGTVGFDYLNNITNYIIEREK